MHQFMVKMGHLFKKASRPFFAPYNEIFFWLFFAIFAIVAISYIIHQLMVKVGHLEFSKALILPHVLIHCKSGGTYLKDSKTIFGTF